MAWLTSLVDHFATRAVSETVEHRLGPRLRDTSMRLGGVPDHAWREPYAMGFLATLITLVAAAVRRLGPSALATVQISAWQRLTGIEDPSVGERICVLTAGCDGAFLRGCLDARLYFDRWSEGGFNDQNVLNALAGWSEPVDPSGAADYVWSCTIERYLSSLVHPQWQSLQG